MPAPRGRALGAAFEHRVKRDIGGRIYPGLAGDVEGRGLRFECKFRTNLKLGSTTELRSFFDQIKRYEDAEPDTVFALALTGGKTYQNGRTWIAIPMDYFLKLTDPVSLGSVLAEVQRLNQLLEEVHSDDTQSERGTKPRRQSTDSPERRTRRKRSLGGNESELHS